MSSSVTYRGGKTLPRSAARTMNDSSLCNRRYTGNRALKNGRVPVGIGARSRPVPSGLLVLIPFLLLTGGFTLLLATGNFREVIPGRIYRSAQPTPAQLREWISQYGLRTIVNLRGDTAPGAAEENELAAARGVCMFNLALSAYSLLPQPKLVELIEVLKKAEAPMLLHCRQGIDRAGTASALAAWLIGDQPYEQAKWQAFVPPGPWKYKHGPYHISDTLEVYEDYCRRHGLDPDDPNLFERWARTEYHPLYYFVELDAPAELTGRAGQSLAVPLTVTNRSDETLPAGDPKRSFQVISRLRAVDAGADEADLLRALTPLPERDVPPGDSIRVEHAMQLPDQPGTYEVVLDILERGLRGTSFSDQGSPPATAALRVTP